ncbi:hypothetical protein T484DRAFT_1612363, partial [Baffinella frigidus]
PKPEARSPKPEARNRKPETRNPRPETRSPKPENGNPKPETRNPKPEHAPQLVCRSECPMLKYVRIEQWYAQSQPVTRGDVVWRQGTMHDPLLDYHEIPS